MHSEPYETKKYKCPNLGKRVVEIRQSSSSPNDPPLMVTPLDSWRNLLMDELLEWCRVEPIGVKAHPYFADIKKAILDIT